MKGIMQGDKEIKVFEVSETDWWAGGDPASVKEAYIKFNNIGDSEDDREDFGVHEVPEELTDEAMDKLRYSDDEDDTKRSFREQLQRMVDKGDEFPIMFATTEY